MNNLIKNITLFRLIVVGYLAIADGMFNSVNITKLYAKHPLIRFAYTMFGAYNVFGSDVGMDLGFKMSVIACVAMMIILELIHRYIATEQERQDNEFVSFLSQHWQNYVVLGLIVVIFLQSDKMDKILNSSIS